MDQIVKDILSAPPGECPFVVAPESKASYELKDIIPLVIHVLSGEDNFDVIQSLGTLQNFVAQNAMKHMKIQQDIDQDVSTLVCGAAVCCLADIQCDNKPFECEAEPAAVLPSHRDADPVAFAKAILWPCNFWDFACSSGAIHEYARWISQYIFLPPEDEKWTCVEIAHMVAPVCFAWNLISWFQDCDVLMAEDLISDAERKRVDHLIDLSRPNHERAVDSISEYLAQGLIPFGVYLTDQRFVVSKDAWKSGAPSMLQKHTDVNRVTWFQQQKVAEGKERHTRMADATDMVAVDLLFAASFIGTCETIFHQYIITWAEWTDCEKVEHLMNSETFFRRPCRPVMCQLGAERWAVRAKVKPEPDALSYTRRLVVYCTSFREAFAVWLHLVREYFDNQTETEDDMLILCTPS
jgi:hypothetical protein